MQPFLSQLATEISTQDASSICVVFPSRRAGLFFQDTCARLLSTAGPVPTALSFEDFLSEITGAVMADALTLAFELYPDYARLFPDETFDKYYSWVSTLLEGFEETTQALADPQKVFAQIKELREIDATIESWDQPGESHEFRERYLKLWSALPELYKQLVAKLNAQNLFTPALALTQAIARFEQGSLTLPWTRIWFAGFGTFTRAEEKLVRLLMKAGLAECRWDLDQWYVDQPMQEAGRFFRQLKERWKLKELPYTQSILASESKKIKVIGVAGLSGQAKVAGLTLAGMGRETLGRETAVILPDEGLLFALLNSLPPSVKEVNVTMGFPLRGTPLYALTDAVLQAHERAAALPGGKWQFYHRDVTALLRHPYLRALRPEVCRALQDTLERENLVYLNSAEIAAVTEPLEGGALIARIFSEPAAPAEWMALFLELMNALRQWMETRMEERNKRSDPELELLFHFRSLLHRVQDKLEQPVQGVDLKTFRRVFRELIRQATIPFTGEPLAGLQIMGVLESRSLDFENLIILSVNEGVMPAHSRKPSFIPYTVRKAFGLPVFEDRDGIFAWNFYRLIQRARNITLIYNTEPSVLGGGERSRYISQLEAELRDANPLLEWTEEIASFSSLSPAPAAISVVKTQEMIDGILNLGEERGISPSALNTYLACSLQFYFRYVKRLHERNEVEESAGGDTFGQVFHALMESLYAPLVGKTVQAPDLDEIKERVQDESESIFKEVARTRNVAHGKNHLLLGVLRELALKVIELDQAHAPFQLEALEHELTLPVVTPGGTLKLRGILDRVHRKGNTTLIIDYKTGETGSLRMEEPSRAGADAKRKEAFQLATYALLQQSQPGASGSVQSGILSLRNLSKGIQWLEMGLQKETELSAASLRDFDDRVHELIHEMLSPEVLFSQTADTDVCKFCGYKEICNRQ